ncbi:MAG TPA: glycosyltransferase [Bacteroidetes bacterium]|nr:glycosyltransferase [Bacteroidota bacterium]
MLYQMLEDDFDVEIIGPASNKGIWFPLRSLKGIHIKISRTRNMLKMIDGEIVFASKPLIGSFGVGILAKILKGKKLLVDIDDWQLGFIKHEYSKLNFAQKVIRLVKDLKRFFYIDSYWNCMLCEKLLFFSDGITVSNSFLKNRFKGTTIYHVRDETLFNPERFQKNALREEHNIPINDKIILFLGTIRSHKGIESLISAIHEIKNQHVKLMLINSCDDNYSLGLKNEAESKLGKRVILLGPISFEETPEFLAIADLYVIPQTESFASSGQIPAKLFDAMSMGLPIIATNISDIPDILQECGWIVKSNSPAEIASAIIHAIENPDEAIKKGKKARQIYLETYSLKIVKPKLTNFVFEIIQNSKS